MGALFTSTYTAAAHGNSLWLWLVLGSFLALLALVGATFFTGHRRRSFRSKSSSTDLTTDVSTEVTLAELIPDSCFVKVGDTHLHYVQAGDQAGGDVVLLHGIGASVFIWRFVFPILQARHRVTAFDFAGFGKSSKTAKSGYGLDAQAESIAAALTQLGIEQATLVGSSMGGTIALWMAHRWPERFHHVAALGPATDSGRVPMMAQHFAVTAPLLRHTVNKRTIKLILGYIISNKKIITDEVVERYLEPFRDRGESLRAFVAATSVLSDRRLPRGFAGLRSKILLVWGGNDLLVTRRSLVRLQKILPHAVLIDHPTGGHHIMEDEPVWVARQLERFLSGEAANAAKTPPTSV